MAWGLELLEDLPLYLAYAVLAGLPLAATVVVLCGCKVSGRESRREEALDVLIERDAVEIEALRERLAGRTRHLRRVK